MMVEEMKMSFFAQLMSGADSVQDASLENIPHLHHLHHNTSAN